MRIVNCKKHNTFDTYYNQFKCSMSHIDNIYEPSKRNEDQLFKNNMRCQNENCEHIIQTRPLLIQ